MDEALQRLKQQGRPDEDGWIYACAIDQTSYEEKHGPTLQELDALFPDLPVFVFHMAEEALLSYTQEAAIVLGIEDQVGTLEPGKYADFVVRSENPLGIDPMKIRGIQVEATAMNRRITHMASTTGFYHH